MQELEDFKLLLIDLKLLEPTKENNDFIILVETKIAELENF